MNFNKFFRMAIIIFVTNMEMFCVYLVGKKKKSSALKQFVIHHVLMVKETAVKLVHYKRVFFVFS